MGKIRITRRELLQEKDKCRSIGYGQAQYLLFFCTPTAYNCGVYGWNFDVYDINGYHITTGHRGMVGKTANNVEQYEKIAESIVHDYSLTYDEQREKLESLRDEFIKQM